MPDIIKWPNKKFNERDTIESWLKHAGASGIKPQCYKTILPPSTLLDTLLFRSHLRKNDNKYLNWRKRSVSSSVEQREYDFGMIVN